MNESTSAVHDACRRIGDNPVSHLGLANKELFHSNFLAWLAESEPGAASIVLSAISQPDPTCTEHRVRREHKHLDLVIELPGYRPIVIENKTFAIADLEQLRRYSADKWLQATDPTCVLLSLGDPGWPQHLAEVDGRRWTWFAYTALADGLRSALHAVRDDFGVVLIKRYIALLDDLVVVCEAFTDPDDGAMLLPAPRDLTPLRRTRLHDGVLKLRVRSIGAQLERSSSAILGRHLDRVATGFTRSHPLVEMFAGSRRTSSGLPRSFRHSPAEPLSSVSSDPKQPIGCARTASGSTSQLRTRSSATSPCRWRRGSRMLTGSIGSIRTSSMPTG